MNKSEEVALLADLRRRGQQIISVSELSCPPDEYRRDARRLGRAQGWKIRTFLLADGAAVAILWTDREKTDLEEEATRRVMNAMFTENPLHYDDALEAVRRENLRIIKEGD